MGLKRSRFETLYAGSRLVKLTKVSSGIIRMIRWKSRVYSGLEDPALIPVNHSLCCGKQQTLVYVWTAALVVTRVAGVTA